MTPRLSLADVVARLDAKRNGEGWKAKCPAHEDANPSLAISEATDGKVLVHCHAGCSFESVVAAMQVEPGALFPESQNGNGGGHEIVATYDYTDAAGKLLYQSVRFAPKDFRQRRPDPSGKDGWTWNLKGVERVLYRLPDVLAAVKEGKRVVIVEGEKDADAIRVRGHVATTNPGGAGKWRPEYSEALRGADVLIIPDKDAPGFAHAKHVAESLEGVAKSVKMLQALVGKDVSEHLEAGKKLSELAPLEPVPTLPTTTPSDDGFVGVGDLVAEPDNPTPWVVYGLIPSSGLALIAGKPKAGKSTLARAIALRVARGEPVLGRPTTKGLVLYLGLEDPRDYTKGHFKRMGATDTDTPTLKCWFPGINGQPSEAQLWLKTMLAKYEPILVVIDTMQFFLGIEDVNAYGETVNALRSILAILRPSQTAGIIVHHAGKGDRVGFDAILGSTGIGGTVDTSILVKRRDDNTRTLATQQRMHAPDLDDVPESILELSDILEPRLMGTRAELDLANIGKDMLGNRAILDDWTTTSDVLEAVEGKKETKLRALGDLYAKGLVERSGAGKKGDPHLYRRPVAGGAVVPRVVVPAPRPPEPEPDLGLGLATAYTQQREAPVALAQVCAKGHAMKHKDGARPTEGWVCTICNPDVAAIMGIPA